MAGNALRGRVLDAALLVRMVVVMVWTDLGMVEVAAQCVTVIVMVAGGETSRSASSSPSSSFLVSHTLPTASSPTTAPAFRTWEDVTPRILLPSTPHSLHVLSLPSASSTLLTVAFNDGALSALLPGSLTLTPLLPASSTPLLSAASHQNTICTLHEAEAQANGISSGSSTAGCKSSSSSSPCAVLRVFSTTSQGGLRLRHTCNLTAPSAGCQIQGSVSVCATYALVQWTGGWVSVVHGLKSTSLQVKQLHVQQQPTAAATPAPGDPQPAVSAAAPHSVGKKRKEQSAAATPAAKPTPGSAPTFLCCAVDASQLLVLDLSVAASEGSNYALVDTQFGCPLSSGQLPSVSDALQSQRNILHTSSPASTATPSHSLTLQQGSSTPDRAQILLQLGGVVLQLDVPVGRADLMSMIGRLSTASLQAASAKAKSPLAAQNVFLQVNLTPVLAACATAAGSSSAAPSAASDPAPDDSAAAQRAAEDDGCDVLHTVQDGLLHASQPHSKAVELLLQMRQVPLPPTPAELLEKVLLLFTRSGTHPAAALNMAPALTTQLLSAFLTTAVEAEAWPQLTSLMQVLRPEEGGAKTLRLRLPTCPGLLPALAAAGRYELLQLAAAQLVEVSSSDLVSALATLLSPAGATIVQLRKANYQRLRGQASKVLDKAAAPGPSEHQELDIVNARAAAAAIDGFTASEVTLHALVALHVDGIEAQAAARACLSNAQVDAFLSYLSKWVDKYTDAMCDAAPAFGTQPHLLPEALLFPRFTQVLDWVKAIVDGHLARLLMTRSPLPHINKLQSTLSLQVKCTEQLSLLRGVMDHMMARAPLPRAHVAAAQQYTVEVLDLSIRAQ
ncbi:MAG: hypothetical protein WDW36_006008 [Sanguina aurantia]